MTAVSARPAVAEADFVEAVAAAVRAPSMHNTQPWLFRHDRVHNRVEVRLDRSRMLPVADAGGWAARIACGAAACNLRLGFAVRGRPFALTWLPDNTDPELAAVLTPTRPEPATADDMRLFQAITHRHTSRAPFSTAPVSREARAAIVRAARDALPSEFTWFELISGAAPVAAVAEITRTAQQVLDRNPAYVAELRSWTRRRADSTDGIPVAAAGPPPLPEDPFPQRVFAGAQRAPDVAYEAEPLVAVLGTSGDLAIDHLRAGYALQLVLLTITDLGLASSMFSQPIEVPAAREQLRLALGRHGTPQMVLRIGQPRSVPSDDVGDIAATDGDLGVPRDHIGISTEPHSGRRPAGEVIAP